MSLVVGFTLSRLAYLYWRWKQERLLVLIAVLLTLQNRLNWFCASDPQRQRFRRPSADQTTKDVAEEFKGRKCHLQQTLAADQFLYPDQRAGSDRPRKSDNFDKDILYIIDPPTGN